MKLQLHLLRQIGNLVGDVSEQIDTIKWNVYGKITDVIRTASSTKSDLHFEYDAMGNRICKIVKPRSGSGVYNQDHWTYTYYVRDAQGNTIAVYDRDYDTPGSTYNDIFTLKENHLYGSSRVGVRAVSELQANVRYTYGGVSGGVYSGDFARADDYCGGNEGLLPRSGTALVRARQSPRECAGDCIRRAHGKS